MSKRSDLMTKGPERAPHRSLLRAEGFTDWEMERPIIGIANSFNEIIPGHSHLDKLVDAVKAGIYAAGGTPVVFNTIGVCDGIAMNHVGMKYSLPSRELIADSLEIMAMAHPFDGLVMMASCDKIIPGMLIAAARLNIPSIFLPGGPMLPGRVLGRDTGLDKVFEAVGRYKAGKISGGELKKFECAACPGAGSCSGMFTANTMSNLSEALGMTLPLGGSAPAVYADRIWIAKETGRAAVQIVKNRIRPRDIMTREAFHNAIATDMALGGSTNSALHLPAIAYYAEVDVTLADFGQFTDKTPHLTSLAPAGPHHVVDFFHAGGIPAVMAELRKGGLIHEKCLTVFGLPVGKMLDAIKAGTRDKAVIRTLKDPVHRTAARRASSTRRKTPSRPSWPAGSARATWWWSATKGRRAAPACRRCCPRPRPWPAWAWTRRWPSLPTDASRARAAARPSDTFRRKPPPAGRLPRSRKAIRSRSTSPARA
jgi:dihydroxy-acid dehydratase